MRRCPGTSLMRAGQLTCLATGLTLATTPALAAGLEGTQLGLVWALPFFGLLLSIAILPQLAPHFWDHHIGKLVGAWSLGVIVPLWLFHGPSATADALVHVLLAEYLPFILLLASLYTIAGGIVVVGRLRGTPALNTGLLAFGTLLASLIGTTGASMVLIGPMIRANAHRRHRAHVVVFFIFLVSNIGGCLTPLGDPPLFLGFLRGIDFFWTTRELFAETLFVVALLLGLFYLLDRFPFRDEAEPVAEDADEPLRLRGRINFLLLGALVGLILVSGVWQPGVVGKVGSTEFQGQNVLRDLGMVVLALASFWLTAKRNRAANDFSWRPIVEVAKIFAGIFVCIVPVAAALQAGGAGPFAPLLAVVSQSDGSPNPAAYFWATGLLSSVLDNAPTYLVFFDLAGGDPGRLMGPLAATLAAISTGAVFMGANTYIGNAPNYMVYAIARSAGVKMPGFVGYMAWSGAILIPTFVLVTLVFFR
jgi:Na+/H+ antiporter NhaD/arsenite permease-like protein